MREGSKNRRQVCSMRDENSAVTTTRQPNHVQWRTESFRAVQPTARPQGDKNSTAIQKFGALIPVYLYYYIIKQFPID